ncbi:MAG: molybdopterin molybdotransferase MoeA [Steroidobacteraceae bacterium]
MADAAIRTHVAPLSAVLRPLEQSIGQTLRQDIFAERDNPPFDRVCMDGIAIWSETLNRGVRRFKVQATQSAGTPPVTLAGADLAVEVMTGAVLPRGTDCVIPLEEYDLVEGVAMLAEKVSGAPFRNVQRRGEDSELGIPMLTPGIRLGAPEIAVVASAGLGRVHVSRQPNVAVISTGDELVEPGEPIAEHQIRRSNAYAVLAALRMRGFEQARHDHIRDDEALLRERLAQHLASNDLLVLSGGVSKGKFDFVPKALTHLGIREIFYKVAQRPGMPMWFGIGARGQAVFGLPGNPVSTLICLVRYVVPALHIAMATRPDPPMRVSLASEFRFERPATCFLPVSVAPDSLGRPVAIAKSPNGPGDFLSLTESHGFVELPPQSEPFAQGFVADFHRW